MKTLPPIVRFRIALGIFITGLVLSGVTAFPLLTELRLLHQLTGPPAPGSGEGRGFWIATVRHGLEDTYAKYPWVAYGTDWLAFGHLVIALFFVGPFLHQKPPAPISSPASPPASPSSRSPSSAAPSAASHSTGSSSIAASEPSGLFR